MLQGIVELQKKGLYSSAVIKKRRYWPAGVKGDDVINHFEDKEIGSYDALPGELDGVPFHLVCMKEENYVMNLMSTYGTMKEVKTAHRTIKKKTQDVRKISFPLTEVHHNHFKGRHSVDDNNKQRMQPIALEKTWRTKDWENRPFAFLLGLSAANCQYAWHWFGGHEEETVLQFRKQMAHDLIFNDWVPSNTTIRSSARKRQRVVPITTVCQLETIPKYMKFEGIKLVPSVYIYPKKTCARCGTKCRTYCKCTIGRHLCLSCLPSHVVEVQHVRSQSGPN